MPHDSIISKIPIHSSFRSTSSINSHSPLLNFCLALSKSQATRPCHRSISHHPYFFYLYITQVNALSAKMSFPAEYVFANVEMAKAQSKQQQKPKMVRTNPMSAACSILGTPMSVPAEYIVARMRAEESRVHHTPATSGKTPRNTQPRTSDVSSLSSIGTPMAVPAEYVWAKEQEMRSLERSRGSPTPSSGSRSSVEVDSPRPAIVGSGPLLRCSMEFAV